VKDITVVQDRKNDASKQLIADAKQRGRVELDPASFHFLCQVLPIAIFHAEPNDCLTHYKGQ
jgi:hypothetical protein